MLRRIRKILANICQSRPPTTQLGCYPAPGKPVRLRIRSIICDPLIIPAVDCVGTVDPGGNDNRRATALNIGQTCRHPCVSDAELVERETRRGACRQRSELVRAIGAVVSVMAGVSGKTRGEVKDLEYREPRIAESRELHGTTRVEKRELKMTTTKTAPTNLSANPRGVGFAKIAANHDKVVGRGGRSILTSAVTLKEVELWHIAAPGAVEVPAIGVPNGRIPKIGPPHVPVLPSRKDRVAVLFVPASEVGGSLI